MPQQKPRMRHRWNLLTELLKMMMWLIARCFSVRDKHDLGSNVIWLPTTWLLIFWLDVANIYKACQSMNWNFLFKRDNFSRLQTFVPEPRLLHREMSFAITSKIIRNWFLILQSNTLQSLDSHFEKKKYSKWAHNCSFSVFFYLSL